jgi:hypothetical protein
LVSPLFPKFSVLPFDRTQITLKVTTHFLDITVVHFLKVIE